MSDLTKTSEELFNKIRGRFPSVTIGDEAGEITTDPLAARYFNFKYQYEGETLNEISISISDEELLIIYSRNFLTNQSDDVKRDWYNFLKEMRQFAKKRLIKFDVRDITKSNLTKRDYKFLSQNVGDSNMNESVMYGTNKTSYQRIGNARLAIKHLAPINVESSASRTQKIGSIFIESPDGEKFRYPFRHLSGARAMARHVSEGGNAYDDFGKYISGLSEELSKLRKFSTYVNRSGVMAETLGGYSDIVKERSVAIRKEIQNLQKENYYKETVEGFSAPIVEDVPEDVAENWIDQLTIKQFNEELKDVFPYIYKLVGEATKAKELGPEDLEEVLTANESFELEQTFEEGLRPGVEFDLSRTKDHNGYVLGSVEDGSATWWSVYKDLGDGTYKEVMPVKDPETGGKSSVSRFSRNLPFDQFVWTVDNMLSKTREDFDQVGEAGDKPLDPRWKEPASRTARELKTQIRGLDDIALDKWGQDTDTKSFANRLLKSKTRKMQDKLTKSELRRRADKTTSEDFDQVDEISPELAKRYTKAAKRDKFDNDEEIAANIDWMGDLSEPPEGAVRSAAQDPVRWAGIAYNDNVKLQKRNAKRQAGIDRAAKRLEDIEIEAAFESMMGQFSDHVCEDCGNLSWRTLSEEKQKGLDGKVCWKGYRRMGTKMKGGKRVDNCVKVSEADDTIDVKMTPQGMGKADMALEKPKTPLGEFILSYFDRETGKFPKGETAVLTAVEKDYGDEYVEPARQFIEQVQTTTLEYIQREASQSRYPETEMIKKLAGL
jgi:hypothetical protein